MFVSDNPAYDFQWINFYFWRYFGMNPFGHSGQRVADFYAGLVGDFYRRRTGSVSAERSTIIIRPMTRHKVAFGALVLTQSAHSVEEYAGRLWETFPPARFLTGLVSQDQGRGFLLINIALVAFGVWCFMWPIRRDWPTAALIAWIWVAIELINGVGHPLWSLRMGHYTPGAATAPVLLAVALYLAGQLRTMAHRRDQ